MLLSIKNNIFCLLIFFFYGWAYANEKPTFTSTPIVWIEKDIYYNYQITVEDPDNDSLSIIVISKPDWLWFENNKEDTAYLYGTPTSHDGNVSLAVTDGIDTTFQEFTITVSCPNCCFVIFPPTVSSIKPGDEFVYLPQILDIDGDTIIITFDTVPHWIEVNYTNPDRPFLYGIPSIDDIGIYTISIKAEQKGLCHEVIVSSFNITVTKPKENLILVSERNSELTIAPNPFNESLNITSINSTFPITFEVINSAGTVLYQKTFSNSSENMQLDLSFLNSDIFFLRAIYFNNVQVFKIIKQ
jgi:hypothetical protein